MIKLIGNELYKILHKKLLYVILIIAIGFTVAGLVVEKLITSNELDVEIQADKKLMEVYESTGDTTSPQYWSTRQELKMAELKKEKGVSQESPEAYYIDTVVAANYSAYMNASSDSQILPEILEESKQTYEQSVKKLDSFNWKDLINDEINELVIDNEECSFDTQEKCNTYKSERKRVLEYRLNHNIPYANNEASNILMNYIEYLRYYLESKDKDEKVLSYENIVNKRQYEKMYFEYKYKIDNEMVKSDSKMFTTGADLISSFEAPSFLVIIVLLALSASTVAEEFNKGTIKQLLVKPYSRTKIVLSKFFAVLIVTISMLFILNIATTLINGLFNGDLKTVLDTSVVYDFNAHKAIPISTIKYSLLCFVYVLPKIILLSIFVFAVSVLFTNTAFALGMGFGAYLSEQIFGLLIPRFKFLSYMPTVNYDLTPYMFGRIHDIEQLTFNNAIMVDSISFVVLFIFIIVVFKNKDIKNQ